MAFYLCNASPWVLCGLGSCVELNRSSFLEPEGLSKARKSVVITRKLTVSVGEIVNGGPLPPIPRHTPVCSFNSQNKYVGESLAAELPTGTQRPGLDSGEELRYVTELAVAPSGSLLGARSICLVLRVRGRSGGHWLSAHVFCSS